jgi:hypothetical protein
MKVVSHAKAVRNASQEYRKLYMLLIGAPGGVCPQEIDTANMHYKYGELVNTLFATAGEDSAEFKEASAKYKALLPLWLAYKSAVDALIKVLEQMR